VQAGADAPRLAARLSWFRCCSNRAKDIVASRIVIDVSDDGPNNDGNPMTPAHDKTLAQGIVMNGLPVMDDNANGYFPNLDKYYAASHGA
jgi:hypothetical protein